MEPSVGDGFLANRICKQEWSDDVREQAKKIIDLTVLGREQQKTGRLCENSVEASERYLLLVEFLLFFKGEYLGPDALETKAILFDLLTFSGNYMTFWMWFRDWTVNELSRRNYEHIAF